MDPNMPEDMLEDMDHARLEHNKTAELELVHAVVDDSPYPEVRAAVRNVSDANHPSLHIR